MPRVMISGLNGGAGKTIISLGISRALKNMGLLVKPFKKGPDYIDAKWLSLACGHDATNLDPFFFSKEKLKSLFCYSNQGFDLSLIEGNRGLFDGKDLLGSCSSAELSRQLQCPTILVIDCTKITRTVAAILYGCMHFEQDLDLRGVILNRLGSSRHEAIIRESIQYYTGLPVLGSLPRLPKDPLPQRYLGVLPSSEHENPESILDTLSMHISKNVDITAVTKIAFSATQYQTKPCIEFSEIFTPKIKKDIRIGVVKDSAFWFYYHENLQALEFCGAKLVEVSLLDDSRLLDLHGLYLGGGFPEIMAQQLSKNIKKRELVLKLATAGLPIYAECGGLMYLGKNIVYNNNTYPMAGLFPFSTSLTKKPQGHGYTEAIVRIKNPFFPVGMSILAHEFHYSKCDDEGSEDRKYALDIKRGVGISGAKDGLLFKNVFATYLHTHVLANSCWASNFAIAADKYRNGDSNIGA